ncbi:(E3-independent) E2 ubiquitin-conjugating enzyme-like [Adelges cooleyi]|uniref:(E3-independent) E2 ubiquitin-conjugating enzyme-like n=1 Tax=Adelges cooleyi TaxID=133065 RepID=UPI00217FB4D0|nr:(E3-independent) E2 ubiquitin-conjugating enzyme-like [Adelges cooleyi]
MDKDDEKFFYEDEVAMVSPKTGLVKYGLVLNTNGSRTESELKKSSKSSNHIKVMWHPNGNEEIMSDDKVVLIDRSLMPGDVVRKVNEGQLTQFGYCENIDIYATVKVLNTNKVIENVSCRNFTQTKPFSIDSSVFYESWVGGVYDVKCQVTFASQDGSIFTLEDPYRQDFISLSTSDSFSIDDNVFYHGQKLKMCLDSLENAKFKKISNLMSCLWHNYKKKFKYGTKWVKVYVQDITVLSVEVEWYCQTYGKTKPREENWPERLITGDNLNKLKTIDLFDSCSIQVGDTHWYQIKDTDNIMTMKQWRAKCTEGFNLKSELLPSKVIKDRRPSKLHPKKLKHSISTDIDNLDDIYAQNMVNRTGSLTQRSERLLSRENKQHSVQPKKCESKPMSVLGNSSIHTLKSNRLKRNRMWKSLVKKSKQFNVPKVSTKPNSKVVVEVCYTKSVVDVVWQDGTKETGVSSTDLYPVPTLDDLEFFPGDFVTEKYPLPDVYGVIESVDHAERTARVQWFKVIPDNPSLPNRIEKTDISVYDLRDHPDFHFKSGCLIIHISPDSYPNKNTLTAGQVLSAGPDGKILVMWVNGEKTECWPQELFVVKLHDDDDAFSMLDDDDDFTDDDDAPLADDDDLSEDWMSLASPKSSESHDQENNEKFPKQLFQSLRKATAGMKSFLDAVVNNRDVDKTTKLQNALEQIKLGFNVSSYLPTNETEEIEKSYKDLMDNVTVMIDKIISKIENNSDDTTEEVSHQTVMGDSVDKLKKIVSDFMDKINCAFKQSCPMNGNGFPLYNYLKNQGLDNLDSEDESTDIRECCTAPIIELQPVSCSQQPENMDTDIEQESEIGVIVKPEEAGVFDVLDTALEGTHKYLDIKTDLNPTMLKIISKDIQILKKSLPAGIWVKTFENRMDLFSIMIRGPEKTPYDGGLFMFDVRLPVTYPHQPPLCHYYSYCFDRLNPNLYEDGKVCLSLLGTWAGHGVELWSPKDSNLLQLIVSIQGLILVNEPYYNEAGFDTQRGQKLARENSRVYNEMALIKVVQSMTNMLKLKLSETKTNTDYFDEEIMEHVQIHGFKLINKIETWIKMSERELTEDEKLVPGYPLLPLSRGFCLSMINALNAYKDVLISMNIIFK